MVMTSDETLIQIFANWAMPHAKRVTRDNRKNLEYRACRCRDKETADRHKLSREKIVAKQHGLAMKIYNSENKLGTKTRLCLRRVKEMLPQGSK